MGRGPHCSYPGAVGRAVDPATKLKAAAGPPMMRTAATMMVTMAASESVVQEAEVRPGAVWLLAGWLMMRTDLPELVVADVATAQAAAEGQ